ncbi:MAG: hypothetical protein OES57_17310, partial [Acidimicrobiia bacterium]|nr:hypothetical protein [Acidimicrobiia bacterium]
MRTTRRWALVLSAALIAAGCSSADDDNSARVVDAPETSSTSTSGQTASSSPTTFPSSTSTSGAPSSTAGPAGGADSCRAGRFVIDEEQAAIFDPAGEPFLPTGINLTTGSYRDGEFWEKTSVTDLTAEHVAVLR